MFTTLLNSALQPANVADGTGPIQSQSWLSADVDNVAHQHMGQTGRPQQLQHCAHAAASSAALSSADAVQHPGSQHSVAAQPWLQVQQNLAARSPQQASQQTPHAASNTEGKCNTLLLAFVLPVDSADHGRAE